MFTRQINGQEVICPQAGPQEAFCASKADIVIYGGAAGGGKSMGLLMEASRHVDVPQYTGVIFRRKYKEIVDGGGLWDTSQQIYSTYNAIPIRGRTEWEFPTGAKVRFNHLNRVQDIYDHQGAAYVFLGFDELTHFEEIQFFYLLSRNRLPAGCSGIKPYCRATCNPDADSWVAKFIKWWWDSETGYPILERAGVIRYFTRIDGEIVWVSPDWRDEYGLPPLSVTFIPSSVEDNPILLLTNPQYRANLQSQDRVTRERLLKGNWLITYSGGMFNPLWFEIVDQVPPGMQLVRYWDMAATEVKEKDKNDPDWTAGALVGIHEGVLYILDMIAFRDSPGKTEQKMRNAATSDGYEVTQFWEEEKGSSGKYTSEYLKQVFTGYNAHPDPVSGSKIERAKPWAAWAEFGRVKLLRGDWNKQFLNRAGKFPDGKRDEIDAVSGGFKVLVDDKRVFAYYSVSPKTGHIKTFSREKEDFEKIQPHNIDIILALYADSDGGIYGGCYLWSKTARRLRLYNEIFHPTPVIDRVAKDIVDKVVVPMTEKDNYVTLGKVICNDELGKYGKNSIGTELRRRGIYAHIASVYDESGSITRVNNMFVRNEIWIHSDCIETDVQWRGWPIGERGPKPGYPLARTLCLVVNYLRVENKFEASTKVPQYSKEKQVIRDYAKSIGTTTEKGLIGPENENEWLLR